MSSNVSRFWNDSSDLVLVGGHTTEYRPKHNPLERFSPGPCGVKFKVFAYEETLDLISRLYLWSRDGQRR